MPYELQNGLNYYLNRDMVHLTDQGVLFKDKLILPIQIKSLDIFYDYSEKGENPKVTCRYGFEYVFISTDNTLFFTYDPQHPQNALKELRQLGVLFKRKENVITVLTIILQRACNLSKSKLGGSEITIKRFHTANHSGWLQVQNQFLYLTSEFAITQTGIDESWHCITPNAYLYFNHALTPKDAYTQMLDLINLDFDSAAPILSTMLLNFLNPFRKAAGLYPAPGMLISGPTSSGKTQLAVHLTHILTKKNDALNEVFILQRGARDLQKSREGLSDAPLILDDIRRSPASSLRQNIAAVMDSITRSCFLEDSEYYQLPILTGECDALDSQLPSWRNRLIEISLDGSHKSMQQRMTLIQQLHSNPHLVRTFVRYFIQFLIRNRNNCVSSTNALSMNSSELEELLSDTILRPDQNQRSYDNLLLSLWGFKIFIQYGVALGVLQKEDADCYIEDYKKTLSLIHYNQVMHDPQNQLLSLFSEIVKRIPIHSAVLTEQKYYPTAAARFKESCNNTYGHYALINYQKNCYGVYIKDSLLLTGYPNSYPSRTLLVLSCDAFQEVFQECLCELHDSRINTQYQAFPKFLKALRKEYLLLGWNRYDSKHPDQVNYRISNYPCYTDYEISDKTPVYVFQLKGQLAKEIEQGCISIPLITYDLCHVTIHDITNCTRLLRDLI